MANILDYNKGLTQYNAGQYQQAQKTVAPFGSNVVKLFAAPVNNSNPFNQVVVQPQGGGSGGSSGGGNDDQARIQAEINSGFDREIQRLDELANYYKGEDYNAGVDTINSSYDLAGKKIGSQVTDADTLAASDTDKIGQSSRSAYDEAIRSYNALNQQSMARFGGSNSAGGAVNSIAQEQYYREQGGISQAKINQEGEVMARKAAAHKWGMEKTSELDTMKLQAMADLKKNLNDKLMEINMRKGDAEKDRTAARLAILQDAVNQTRAIKLADDQFRKNIAAAVAEKQINAGADYNTVMNNYQGIDTTGKPYQQYSYNPNTYAQGLANTQQQSQPAYARNPYLAKNDDDSNPFFS